MGREKAVENSLCFGLFDTRMKDTPQIGYARIVTDNATFAWRQKMLTDFMRSMVLK